MSRSSEHLFYEAQNFRQRRLRLLLAIPPTISTLLMIWQVILGHHSAKQPMSNAGLIGWTIFLWLVYFRLILVRLVTELRSNELLVSMRGLWRTRRVPLADIKSVEVVTFDPVRDYGGYGIRTTRQATAYIAGGHQGVRLELSKSAPIVIGSERSQDLADAIRHLNRAR